MKVKLENLLKRFIKQTVKRIFCKKKNITKCIVDV